MVQAIIEGRKTMTRRKIKLSKADEHPLRQTSQWMQENNTCPYGKVGDVLWVRETFCSDYGIDGCFVFKATWNPKMIEPKWRPSLFMPKAACRIFLEITDIRVERLQDISEADAINEGIEGRFFAGDRPILFKDYYYKYPINDTVPAKFSFRTLWYSINGEKSFDANPFVWVISFKRIEKPDGFS